jgi:hypothetical protein
MAVPGLRPGVLFIPAALRGARFRLLQSSPPGWKRSSKNPPVPPQAYFSSALNP